MQTITVKLHPKNLPPWTYIGRRVAVTKQGQLLPGYATGKMLRYGTLILLDYEALTGEVEIDCTPATHDRPHSAHDPSK